MIKTTDDKSCVEAIDGLAEVYVNDGGSVSLRVTPNDGGDLIALSSEEARDLAELLLDEADLADRRRRAARDAIAKARAERGE